MNEILSHLKNNPQFRKINTASVIEQFIEVLPLKLKKGIKFAYIKNNILYFVLTHPVYKMEFEYNKADIKSLLKKTELKYITEISFFVTNKIEKKSKDQKEYEPFYTERSHGIFENKLEDEKLHLIVEDIRDIIKNS